MDLSEQITFTNNFAYSLKIIDMERPFYLSGRRIDQVNSFITKDEAVFLLQNGEPDTFELMIIERVTQNDQVNRRSAIRLYDLPGSVRHEIRKGFGYELTKEDAFEFTVQG